MYITPFYTTSKRYSVAGTHLCREAIFYFPLKTLQENPSWCMWLFNWKKCISGTCFITTCLQVELSAHCCHWGAHCAIEQSQERLRFNPRKYPNMEKASSNPAYLQKWLCGSKTNRHWFTIQIVSPAPVMLQPDYLYIQSWGRKQTYISAKTTGDHGI